MSFPHTPVVVGRMDWSARSDLGQRRTNNEDYWGAWSLGETVAPLEGESMALPGRGVLLAVSDGMGGAEGGEVASHFCITRLGQLVVEHREAAKPGEALAAVFARVHDELFAKAEEEKALRGMGATLSALWLRPDGMATICHVGDSRIYHSTGRDWRQLTDDQSVGAGMVRRGEMSEETVRRLRYRSMLEQVMGGDGSPIEPQVCHFEWGPGSRFALCSDGLYGPLGGRLEGELDAAFARDNLSAASQGLIDAANAAGGPDNITVILARFVPKSPA